MAFCTKCGKEIPDGKTLCDACAARQQSNFSSSGPGAEKTNRFDPMDIQNNKAMAVLSYIGIFVLIPIFAAKHSPYARYHANQGLLLFLAEVVWSVFSSVFGTVLGYFSMFSPLYWILNGVVSMIFGILSLVFLGMAIYGIVNGATGKAKPLPILGRFTLLH